MPTIADFNSLLKSMNAKYGVHIAVQENNSFHDYNEAWTIIRAGKTAKNSLQIKDLEKKRKELIRKTVKLYRCVKF